MACVWRRDEWGQVTRARLLLWIPGVFLLRLLRKLIDQSSIACCGFAFRQLCMQRPSHKPKKNSKAS